MGRLLATNRELLGLAVTFCLPFLLFYVRRGGVGWGSGGRIGCLALPCNCLCGSRLRMPATKRELSPPSSFPSAATKRELPVFSLHPPPRRHIFIYAAFRPCTWCLPSLHMRCAVRALPVFVAAPSRRFPAPWRGRGCGGVGERLRRGETARRLSHMNCHELNTNYPRIYP